MKLAKFILIILLFASNSLVFAKDSPRELLDSLSEEIGTFRADKASSGYKNAYRKYRSKDIHINIELHEVLIPLKDGCDSKELEEIRQMHLNNAKDTTIQVGYDGEKEVVLENGPKIKLIFVRFLSSDYSKIMADLYLTGIKGYICKIWVTRFGLVVGQKEKKVDEGLRVILSELIE
jgi:hypothetical protein